MTIDNRQIATLDRRDFMAHGRLAALPLAAAASFSAPLLAGVPPEDLSLLGDRLIARILAALTEGGGCIWPSLVEHTIAPAVRGELAAVAGEVAP